MSGSLSVGLTKPQKELLLRGLRYVRSSVLLEPREPCEEVDTDRRAQLDQISQLVSQLNEAEGAPKKG